MRRSPAGSNGGARDHGGGAPRCLGAGRRRDARVRRGQRTAPARRLEKSALRRASGVHKAEESESPIASPQPRFAKTIFISMAYLKALPCI